MPCHTEDRIRVGRYWHCLLGRPLGGYPGTYHNITNGLAGCAGCMADVKSGSTPVGGPVKSGRKRTKEESRGLDKGLVRPELVTAWIQRLRTTSVDPLRRFQSRGWRRKRTETGVVTMVDFRLKSTG